MLRDTGTGVASATSATVPDVSVRLTRLDNGRLVVPVAIGGMTALPAVLVPGGVSRADAGLLPLGALGPVHLDHAGGALVLLSRHRP